MYEVGMPPAARKQVDRYHVPRPPRRWWLVLQQNIANASNIQHDQAFCFRHGWQEQNCSQELTVVHLLYKKRIWCLKWKTDTAWCPNTWSAVREQVRIHNDLQCQKRLRPQTIYLRRADQDSNQSAHQEQTSDSKHYNTNNKSCH